MESLPLAFSSGWASGVNAYLVVLVLGISDRVGDQASIPDVLGRWDVLAIAGFMYAMEFVADKIPYVDSTWDVVSTLIRPTAGAIIGALLAGQVSDDTPLDHIVLAGVVPIVHRNFARTAIATAAVGLLAFSLSNPDGTIARHNIERWRDTGNIDASYLQTLSADAAPAIAKLPPDLRDVALDPLATRLAEGDGWGSLNLSRHRARDVLAAR